MEYEPPVHREPAAVGDVAAALRSLQGGLGRPVHGWAHEPGNVLVVVVVYCSTYNRCSIRTWTSTILDNKSSTLGPEFLVYRRPINS